MASPFVRSSFASIALSILNEFGQGTIGLCRLKLFSESRVLVGYVPNRFAGSNASVDLTTYFGMARGKVGTHGEGHGDNPAAALEMTKWFDTNYHYLVPEFDSHPSFRLATRKPIEEFREARALGILSKLVLIGPVRFLRLGKHHGGGSPLTLLERLLPVYCEVLGLLAAEGAEWVQFDEPIFALDLAESERTALLFTYQLVGAHVPQLRILVASYFGELRENLDTFTRLPVEALHLDAACAATELDPLVEALSRGSHSQPAIVYDKRSVPIPWRQGQTPLPINVRRYFIAAGRAGFPTLRNAWSRFRNHAARTLAVTREAGWPVRFDTSFLSQIKH